MATKKYASGIWDRGDKQIPVWIYGKCNRKDEGIVGYDVRIRPKHIGNPEEGYTATVGGGDCWED